MNRKVLGLAVAFLVLAIMAVPVMADPTKGLKVPIDLHFSDQVVTNVEDRVTDGGVVHRTADVTYVLAIDIDGVPTYTGTAYALREVLIRPSEGGYDIVIRDDYVLVLDGEAGTFEGQAIIRLKGYGPPPPAWDRAKCHALLLGTGVFEGQTINAGHDWVPVGPLLWTGYLLKP